MKRIMCEKDNYAVTEIWFWQVNLRRSLEGGHKSAKLLAQQVSALDKFYCMTGKKYIWNKVSRMAFV